ncbi:MAG: chromate efflux transporter [Burkholderiaceae bacterium]|nr:chromate efflux transporter [Burkholderiaceae bacterium]
MRPVLEVFFAFLKLGLTSFGGPVAHLSYFRNEFVGRRQWLDEHAYGDLVALCQLLPGPSSSQVGMALGLSRAGIPGALAAFVGFTLPSALALMLFGLGLKRVGIGAGAGWLHGLKIVACAVVAQALWSMSKTLTPDGKRAAFAILAALALTAMPSAWSQIAVMAAGGLFGFALLKNEQEVPHHAWPMMLSKAKAVLCLAAFFLLLILLPLAAAATGNHALAMLAGFYRAGALVFGGGHVVLPLLQAQVVRSGWVSNDVFLAGYGAAQAIPGPLFSFAAFLGTVSAGAPSGWLGGILALLAIFAPGFLLTVGTLPFWDALRRHPGTKRALLGVNAAVVGLLLAAFYNPVWTGAIHSPGDFFLGTAAFLLLARWKWPPWLVVILTAIVAGLW